MASSKSGISHRGIAAIIVLAVALVAGLIFARQSSPSADSISSKTAVTLGIVNAVGDKGYHTMSVECSITTHSSHKVLVLIPANDQIKAALSQSVGKRKQIGYQVDKDFSANVVVVELFDGNAPSCPNVPVTTHLTVRDTQVPEAEVGEVVTIHGRNFATVAPGNTIYFNDIKVAQNILADNDTGVKLSFTLGAPVVPGGYMVRVENNAGVSNKIGFTVLAAELVPLQQLAQEHLIRPGRALTPEVAYYAIRKMYRAMFNRDLTPIEKEHKPWADRFGAGDYANVVFGFVQSEEFKANVVNRIRIKNYATQIYAGLYGRTPTEVERSILEKSLATAQGSDEILRLLLREEFSANPLGIVFTVTSDKQQVVNGEEIVLTFNYTNPTEVDINNAVITQSLPATLESEGKSVITIPLGVVKAGETGTKTAKVRYRANRGQ